MLRATHALVAVTLLAVSLAPVVSAAPVIPSEEVNAADVPFVTLDKRDVAVARDDGFTLNVAVHIDRPTSYLESRVQIRRPNGSLLYQKTEIRHEVATGTVTIGYLSDLSLAPDAYPIDVRVRSDAGGEVREWTVTDELLVYDPESPPVHVAVVAKIAAAPLVDPSGRFYADPERYSSAREQAESLAGFVLSRPDAPISLALPPLLAEEWLRASQGYDIAAPDGVESVSPEADGALAHRAALNLVGSALRDGRLELMDIPFADPDPWGLATIGRNHDLASHYERGLSAYLASLETTPSSSTMLAGGGLTPEQASTLRGRGMHTVLVAPESLEDTTAAGGDLGGGLSALTIDEQMALALASGEATTFARAAFEHHIKGDTTATVVAFADLSRPQASAEDIESSVAALEASPWVEFVTLSESSAPSDSAALAADLAPLTVQPPNGYWPLVRESRLLAAALRQAAGPDDLDARTATDASLIAESALWAGRDGSWTLEERGLAHATAAQRTAQEVLGGMRVSASDVTLSSAQGQVPIIVTNASDKDLTVRLRLASEGLVVTAANDADMVLRPGDNYLTLPVDLQSSLAGSLRVEVRSDELVLAHTDVAIRASYLDRLAIVGAVILLLAALLFFIRKRSQRADVDIIEKANPRHMTRSEDRG